MYYSGTITAIRMEIERFDPDEKPTYSELTPGQVAPLSYLLWMCDEVERMNPSSVNDAVKAGRWIGWILAHMEFAGIWTNETSRTVVRADRDHNLDLPH